MRQKSIIVIFFVCFLVLAGTAIAVPTIDGVISPGEWDAYLLGTSVTGWSGGMSVDVYGVVDGGYLYAAYEADTTQLGWPTTCALSIPPNFYYKTPQSAVDPAQGFTLFEMTYDAAGSTPDVNLDVQQTDGVGFAGIGTKAANGITRAWKQPDSGDATCPTGSLGQNIAEFKIPISLLTYGGDDNIIELSGQFWQFGFDDQAFYVTINPPVIVEPAKDSKVAKAQPTANFGTGRYMMVNDKQWGTDRSYLGFDLSSSGLSSVSNADLEIYVYQTGSQVVGSIIEAWYCFNLDFNELTINWNNQFAKWKTNGALLSGNCTLADGYTVLNRVNSGLPETKHTWDMTAEVNQALSSNKKFTVVLKHDTEDKSNNYRYVQYLTRDYSEASFRPHLVMS
ncbi:DNRLRE domain-containing protein [Candidatus Woesearchaeota archaeon]|nr:DNRLRE domain-containing protein [Candidatus Woesearchaeota archaeon]